MLDTYRGGSLATSTKKQEKSHDPASKGYVVREADGKGGYIETFTVGLDAYRNKWLKTDHLSDDDFYAHILSPAVQAFGNFGVREATEADLEKFKDEVGIMELVNKHMFWDAEQERLKNELRAEIIKWVAENVKTKDDLESFLAKNHLNTNQLQAIARGAYPGVQLSDDFIGVFAERVAEKSKKTKYERSAKEVAREFYLPKGRGRK